MISPRRSAQLGLFAACLVLALCVTVLLAFGGSSEPSRVPADLSPSPGILGQPSPERSSQVASFVQVPAHK